VGSDHDSARFAVGVATDFVLMIRGVRNPDVFGRDAAQAKQINRAIGERIVVTARKRLGFLRGRGFEKDFRATNETGIAIARLVASHGARGALCVYEACRDIVVDEPTGAGLVDTFVLTYGGYEPWGSLDATARLAEAVREEFRAHGRLTNSPAKLCVCATYEIAYGRGSRNGSQERAEQHYFRTLVGAWSRASS
jgi:hypothetical protein